MSHWKRFPSKFWLVIPVLPLVLLAVACGAAATATPPPIPTKAPAAPVGAPTPAPTLAAVPKAAPTPTPLPALVVHSGKLTWMIGGWGTERFDPSYASGAGNNYARILHSLVIDINERAQLLPGIAAKWEASKDGKTWTVTIRDGGKFHDGSPITSEDVWWSWMHYWGKDESGSALERSTRGLSQAVARIVDKIEVTRYNQVAITTTVPETGFVSGVISAQAAYTYGVLPKRPKVHDNAQETAYEKNPIGAGPMKLVRHVPSDVMAFEQFDEYYYQPKNGLPEDRRIRFKFLDQRLVPEEATRVAALRAGDADIAPVSLGTRKQVEAGGGRLVFGDEGSVMSVTLLGCYKPQYPCLDKRVRHALAYAIDKELLRDKLFGGPEVFQIKGRIHVTPSTIGYSPALDPFPFDPAKARQLLADAGYPGGKGFGKLVVNTWRSTAIPLLPESAQLAADFWRRELGLDVGVVVADEAATRKRARSNELNGQVEWGDNEARVDAAANVRRTYGDPRAPDRLHDSQELFDVVQKALTVIDPADRVEALNNLYRRLHDEQIEIAVGYVNIPWAVGPRVLRWQPLPLAFYPSNLHSIVLK